jgi:ATP-dependent Lon protease
VTTFILPAKNRKDLRDVAPQVLKKLVVVPVEHVDEVLGVALGAAPERPVLKEVA